MKNIKEIWIVDDPLDGPHIFRTKKQAEAKLKKWEREAHGEIMDSVWDMTGPFRFIKVDE
jgi:hypothetical protein